MKKAFSTCLSLITYNVNYYVNFYFKLYLTTLFTRLFTRLKRVKQLRYNLYLLVNLIRACFRRPHRIYSRKVRTKFYEILFSTTLPSKEEPYFLGRLSISKSFVLLLRGRLNLRSCFSFSIAKQSTDRISESQSLQGLLAWIRRYPQSFVANLTQLTNKNLLNSRQCSFGRFTTYNLTGFKIYQRRSV